MKVNTHLAAMYEYSVFTSPTKYRVFLLYNLKLALYFIFPFFLSQTHNLFYEFEKKSYRFVLELIQLRQAHISVSFFSLINVPNP